MNQRKLTLSLLSHLYLCLLPQLSQCADADTSLSAITNPSQSTTNVAATGSDQTSAVSILTTSQDQRSDADLTTSTQTTNDGIIRWTFQRTQTITASTSRSSTISTTTVPTTKVVENSIDSQVFKLQFTMPEGDIYYNAKFQFGQTEKQELELRLDLIQPHVWVMNEKNFIDCETVSQWFSSIEASYSLLASDSSLPAEITTASQYTENCDKYGLYTSSTDDMPAPTGDINNGDYHIVPYINQAVANGDWVTDDIYFNFTNSYQGKLSNFTFVDANETNMFAGGLGLAGNPRGNGFLYNLVEQGIIKSPGYSLWFNDHANSAIAVGQLIPGIVSTKYYIGDLYSYDIISHRGYKFPAIHQSANQELIELTLPIITLDDVLVENIASGQSLSIKSKSGGIPVLLNSRSLYSYLPLDLIVNLAVQTNAYYSAEIGRWLVQCDTLENINASVQFQMGNFSIQVPINEFIVDALYQDKILNFENGHKACYLTVIPTDSEGFNSLGLPFLRHTYLVVDNEGGKIAMGQSNKYFDPDLISSASSTSTENTSSNTLFNVSSSFSRVSYSQESTASNYSIDYIESGNIPFATPNTYSNDDETLSYSSISSGPDASSSILDIPARLSGAIIRSGSIYISGYSGNINTSTNTEQSTSSSRADSISHHNGLLINTFHMETSLMTTLVSIFVLSLIIL